MNLPPNVKLDSDAEQLLGLKPFEGLEKEEFMMDIPINLVPTGVLSGLEVTLKGPDDLEGDIEAQAEALEEAIQNALKGVQADLKAALDAALRSSVWNWPTGGSRDIYNTGQLLASGRVILSKNKLAVSYGASYASIVHDGGYIFPYGNQNLRPIYLPGRPWISSTLYGGGPVPQFDFKASLMRHLKT